MKIMTQMKCTSGHHWSKLKLSNLLGLAQTRFTVDELINAMKSISNLYFSKKKKKKIYSEVYLKQLK